MKITTSDEQTAHFYRKTLWSWRLGWSIIGGAIGFILLILSMALSGCSTTASKDACSMVPAAQIAVLTAQTQWQAVETNLVASPQTRTQVDTALIAAQGALAVIEAACQAGTNAP